MYVPRFRMVIVERPDKPLDVAYIGEDSIEAEAIFERESSDTNNLATRLFIYPSYSRLRFPSDEAKAARVHDSEAKRQAEAKARSVAADAEKAREHAEKKLAEVEAAWRNLDPETRSRLEAEFEAAEKAKSEAKAKTEADAIAKAKADAEAELKRLESEAAAATAAAEEAARKLAEASGAPVVAPLSSAANPSEAAEIAKALDQVNDPFAFGQEVPPTSGPELLQGAKPKKSKKP